MIKFETPDWETRIINRIIDRACIARNKQRELEMDLRACHCNGTPLDLAALLDADSVAFWNDIRGIQGNINRETGKLGPKFVPAFALSNARKAA